MSQKLPTEEDFQAWLRHPVTEFLREWARVKREDLRDTWEDGNFSASFDTEFIVKNAGATGACSILKLVQDPDYQAMIDEVEDERDKHERLNPAGQGSTGSAL